MTQLLDFNGAGFSSDCTLVRDDFALPAEYWQQVQGYSVLSSDAVRRDSTFGDASVQQIRTQCYLFVKRCLDIIGALVAMVLLSPLIALVACLIKVSDWGPVFYVHRRVGLNGSEFNCVKFRSMVTNADRLKVDLDGQNHHGDSRTFKIPDDPRVTKIGYVIRRLSIDELPQLLNVLMGQMSLVGPRPPLPSEVEKYSLDDMRRLEVKSGLTCIWQVSGRSRLAFPEQLRLDLQYIENRSLWLDLKLLTRTVPAVIRADGAY